jgi:hypothetical protein
MNTEKTCPVKKRHFRTEDQARTRLDEISLKPLLPDRLYTPTNVLRCTCGQYTLTSSQPKPNRRGKTRRTRIVLRRK